MTMTLVPRNLSLALALGALVASAAGDAHAAGGIGNVEQTAVTPHSIALKWSMPSKFQGAFTICVKKGGSLNGACTGDRDGVPNQMANPGDRTLVLTEGIQPNTTYKIKVICRDCKKGKQKRGTERKVGTTTVTTPPLVHDQDKGGIWATAVTGNNLMLHWTSKPLTDPEFEYRVCHKKRWSTFSLKSCFDANNCSADINCHTAANNQRQVLVTGLEPGKNYKIAVAVKKRGAWMNDTEIAELKITTDQ